MMQLCWRVGRVLSVRCLQPFKPLSCLICGQAAVELRSCMQHSMLTLFISSLLAAAVLPAGRQVPGLP
jgi:hypothetical protein